jgi:uncharacterized protein with von Willebrand factor type A (vWA) domain
MTKAINNFETAIDFSLRLFRLLRKHGIQLGTLQTIACTQAIVSLKAANHDRLMLIYRITLINRKEDLFHLQRLFALLLEAYFSPSPDTLNELEDLDNDQELIVKRRTGTDDNSSGDHEEELTEIEGYSIHEVDHHKDFRYMPEEKYPAILAELEKIAKKYTSLARRKTKKSKHSGIIDLRSSIRESVRFDGEILNWRFKKKVLTHTRLVIIVDVSGSMEVYSIFLLNFIYFLNKNHHLKIEVFIFSTRLQPLTEYFRLKNFQAMLEAVSLHFSGWSGGTKIGEAIQELNQTYASLVTPKTVVVIMSDGWDTGDATLLDRAMAKVSNRAKSIVWINPLKADSSYEPLALGMATARPYCDEFVSGHSIESFNTFASLINP